MSEWFGWIEYGARTAAVARGESLDALKARLAELESQVAALKSMLP